MLLPIPDVLTRDELSQARDWLTQARWEDGRRTAGTQAGLVKRNQQIAADDPVLPRLRQLVTQALDRHPLLFSAALPKKWLPPMFNRYDGDGGESQAYGDHVDQAIRHGAQHQRVRTDLSCTLFFSEPDEYDGGELLIEHAFGHERVKLNAGDLVLYPGTSVHQVNPVTRGTRLAAFFWIESMVRSEEQRRLLFDLDMGLMALRNRERAGSDGNDGGESAEAVRLTGVYHNLLRMWADT